MIRITIANDRQTAEFAHGDTPLELGRGPQRDLERIVIEDPYVSRDQLRIESLGPGRIRLTNLGSPLTVVDRGGSGGFDLRATPASEPREVATGEVIDIPLPVRIAAGYSVIDIEPGEPVAPPAAVASLQTLSRPVSVRNLGRQPTDSTLQNLGDSPPPEMLASWFERLLQVQRAAAGSNQFYQETAGAVVDLIGLDRGLVLLRREEGQWELAARHAAREPRGPEFSRKVLEQVVREGRTFFQGLSSNDRSQSLAGVEAVVASPILDENGAVIGVVYGCRDLESPLGQSGIKPLEAQVVQLLAGAVSAGLARLQKEAEAAWARVQFEQFFSRELARELERNPQLLDGQEREVSVLFCDIRGFSRISERLGARETYHLLHDVMDALTNEIMAEGGVVIDYHGDGLAAMWNAPADSERHAVQACQAALAMQATLPNLNERWQPVLGFPLRIGIGVNTGPAQVGNAGSSRRMKYGPLGHTVNLASRVEGATKQFGVQVLVTEHTRHRLVEPFVTRRLCRVRVVGIEGAVSIHELHVAVPDDPWVSLREQYERSLEHFEAGRLEQARQSLETLLNDRRFHDDRATHVLLKAVIAAGERPADDYEPIVELTSK